MFDTIQADQRHFTDTGWLQTYWLFSFSNYYYPGNLRHGTLRVFNDDIVQPHTGFAPHPHEEMEIVTIVLQGEMEHRDTMGNVLNIAKDDVQRMTAGTGLQHSEWNTANQPVHFFQVWILPDKVGLTPSYDQKSFNPANWKNNLTLLASGNGPEDVVTLNTDACLYRAALGAGQCAEYISTNSRSQFIYLINGAATLNGTALYSRDQARISGESMLTIQAQTSTDLVLIDIPQQLPQE